jgi:hypothetical protein
LYDEVRRGYGKIEDVSYFHTENNNQVIIKSNSVSDPDPDWIRIQSGQWIWIRIHESNNDPQKKEKN